MTLKRKKRTKIITLDGDFEGFQFTAKVSASMRTMSKIQTGNFDLIVVALKKVVEGWNFVDEDGNPLPQPHDTVFVDAETDEIIAVQDAESDNDKVKAVIKAAEEAGAEIEEVSPISLLGVDLASAMVMAFGQAVGN